jgi:ribosomal protein S18 acetylase RimI-like enzyme
MLLRHVFGEFYRRGRPRIALGVEATNAQAYSLYEKVGMQRVRQYDEYRKALRC